MQPCKGRNIESRMRDRLVRFNGTLGRLSCTRPSHLPGILSLLTSAHDYGVSSEASKRGPWRQLDASPRLITMGFSFLPKLPHSNFGDAVMSGSSPLSQTSTLQACPCHDSSRLASASLSWSVSLARKGTRVPENYQAWISGDMTLLFRGAPVLWGVYIINDHRGR